MVRNILTGYSSQWLEKSFEENREQKFKLTAYGKNVEKSVDTVGFLRKLV